MADLIEEFEKQILGEIWGSTETYDNLVFLCDKIGNRFAGTKGEKKAAEFAYRKLIEYGLENAFKEPFQYVGWQRGTAKLFVESSDHKELGVISLVQSPSTDPDGLIGEIVSVGDGLPADYEAKGRELEGRICMATSYTPPSFPRWIHRREKYWRAVDAGADGFIFINHIPGYLPATGSLQTNALGEVPAVGISKEDGSYLVRLLRQGTVKVKMEIDNHSEPMTSNFVSGELSGTEYPDRILLVGGHLDAHDISQGAIDNASGIAVLLETSRVLSMFRKILKKTVRFVCFSAEEMSVTGSFQYTQAHKYEMDKVELMLNIDGGGGQGRKHFSVHGCDEIIPFISRYAEEIGYPLVAERRIELYSDNLPFLVQGCPTIGLEGTTSPTVSGRGFIHTRADTVDKVDPIDLKEAVMVTAQFLLRVANEDEQVARHRDETEIVRLLRNANLEETLRVQRQWPFGT